MTTPLSHLAASLQASTSSQPAKAWLTGLSVQLDAWPSTSAHPNLVINPGPPPMDLEPNLDIEPDLPDEPSAPKKPFLIAEYVLRHPAKSQPPARVHSQAGALQIWLDAAARDLRETRVETRRRAGRAFYASLGLGIVGTIALSVGVGLLFTGVIAVGVTSTIPGAISGTFSGVFAKIYRTENADLKQLVGDLRKIEEARIGLWLADQLTNSTERDQAIRGLIGRIQGASKRPTEGV